MSRCTHTTHRTIGYVDNEPVPWCEDCGAHWVDDNDAWVLPNNCTAPCTHPRIEEIKAMVAASAETMTQAAAALMLRIEALELRNLASACPYCHGEGRLTLVNDNGQRMVGMYCPSCLPPGMQRA
ncbi:MAG: hypothetical protein EOO38_06450 [Cytophagaceae bacterium]|nr:MAG: hypothetical protein EOO38_06450 [Cytophagaceae bacterium]